MRGGEDKTSEKEKLKLTYSRILQRNIVKIRVQRKQRMTNPQDIERCRQIVKKKDRCKEKM